LSLRRKELACSAESLRYWAKSAPQSLAIASDQERLTKIEFSEMVNACAEKLSRIPQLPSFLPVLVGTNISSVILYHAAIISRTPVALIDGNTNPRNLEKILERLRNPEFAVVTAPEFSGLLNAEVNQLIVGRERQTDFAIPEVDIEESATVIFSSGSTGEPKGVVWSWKNLDNAFNTMARYYANETNLSLGRVTSIAYAAGAYQMLSAALNHDLHLINPTNTPDEIIDFINQNELHQISFSSSLVERIYDLRSSDKFLHTVNDVLTYGEALSWEQIRKVRELTMGKAKIRASYGASESPGFVLYLEINPAAPLGTGRVPIGYLSQIENLDLIPHAEDPTISSIVIKNFVARGYLDDAELTSEKFNVNEVGERCYHTGDLVRVDEDGMISFVGRSDDLVKINGRFVGPDESESLLRELPGVLNVVVLPHVTAAGKNYLVGHLVLSHESLLTPADIYEYLLKNLSSHLVPAQLVRHEVLPLNSNGKVDRKALQGKQWQRWTGIENSETISVFESFTLSQLRRILNTPDLTISEDIFGSGMDSLAALEFEMIAEEFGYKNVKPHIFLEHRTVQSIARFLEKDRPYSQDNFITINKAGASTPCFIFPGAGVSAIFFKEFADLLGPHQSVVVIEPKGMHTTQETEGSLEEMALSASMEIAIRVPEGRINLIGHSAGAAIACEVGILLTSMGRQVSLVSLDNSGIASGVSMSPRLSKRFRRIRVILRRSPQHIFKSIQRRYRARDKSSYAFFTLHIGKLAMNYKPKIKPQFPILFLYCASSMSREPWVDSSQYKFVEIQGSHSTMLNHKYLLDVVSKIRDYLKI
jgi:acyl-coenzyme A synthetase/AMP-(fatty) acid ligase